MGNTELKTAFSSAYTDESLKVELQFTPEILLEDHLLSHLESYVKSKLKVKEFTSSKAFPETNI